MEKGAVVAVTGRSGSGKSTVSAHYAALGYPVLDGDKIARDVTRPGAPCLTALAVQFGADILDGAGALRRGVLAARAFSTPEGTRLLTDITHPAIVRALLEGVEQARRAGARLVFVDGAAIVGEAFEPYCQAIVVVTSPHREAVSRIMLRDGISKEAARQRLAAQMSEEQMCAAADYVIQNDQNKAALLFRADAVLAALLEKETHGEKEIP